MDVKTAIEKGVAAGQVQPQSQGKSGVHVCVPFSEQSGGGW